MHYITGYSSNPTAYKHTDRTIDYFSDTDYGYDNATRNWTVTTLQDEIQIALIDTPFTINQYICVSAIQCDRDSCICGCISTQTRNFKHIEAEDLNDNIYGAQYIT